MPKRHFTRQHVIGTSIAILCRVIDLKSKWAHYGQKTFHEATCLLNALLNRDFKIFDWFYREHITFVAMHSVHLTSKWLITIDKPLSRRSTSHQIKVSLIAKYLNMTSLFLFCSLPNYISQRPIAKNQIHSDNILGTSV